LSIDEAGAAWGAGGGDTGWGAATGGGGRTGAGAGALTGGFTVVAGAAQPARSSRSNNPRRMIESYATGGCAFNHKRAKSLSGVRFWTRRRR
jgi:hypothetical protein